jgi:hypothetical protein
MHGRSAVSQSALAALPRKQSVTTLASALALNSAQPLVFMRFQPAWTYINGVREFVSFFCETTFGRQEVADRAQVIIQETLENAVKYSDTSARSELELEIRAEDGKIEFSVTSLPDPAHVESLKAELTGLNAQEPEQAYMSAFLRASNEPEASARLGLARIRYEGGVELSLQEQAAGRIRLTAIGTL